MNQFFTEFSVLLEDLDLTPGQFLMVGDLNFHVNDSQDKDAMRFLEILEAHGLKQHVPLVPTHRNGHTLDLVITRELHHNGHSVHVMDPCLSDHQAIHSSSLSGSLGSPARS